MMDLVKHLLRYDCDYITINEIRGEETKGLWTGVGHWTGRSSVYSRGVARGASCQEVLKTVELVAQMRSTTEYDVGDLDHYYEFLGGVRRTIELLTGKRVEALLGRHHGRQGLRQGRGRDRGVLR